MKTDLNLAWIIPKILIHMYKTLDNITPAVIVDPSKMLMVAQLVEHQVVILEVVSSILIHQPKGPIV